MHHDDMEQQELIDGRPVLRGIELRYFLTLTLRAAHGPLMVARLIRSIEEAGFAIEGRPSKTVSDALRWEIRRGRVERVARATYWFRAAPRPTIHRMQKRIRERTQRRIV